MPSTAATWTPEIGLTLAVTVAALGLFVWNRLRVEVVGLLVMLAVIGLGLVSPEEGVAGFAHPATVTVAAMLGLSVALVRTGVIDLLGKRIEALAGGRELRLLVLLIAIVMPVSALVNTTAAVAILLPMVVGLCHEGGIAPSRLLMPLSFAGQLGGTLTLVGTSTNLLVAGIAADSGLGSLGLFEITPAALPLAVVGALYLFTVGRWLVPRRASDADRLTSRELREFLSELVVREESGLVGRPVGDELPLAGPGPRLLAVRRGDRRVEPGETGFRYQAGDRLLVRGRPTEITAIAHAEDLTLEATASELAVDGEADGELRTAEMMVGPRSDVVGRTLDSLGAVLPEAVSVLAMERHGANVEEPLGEVELASGDILLVRAPLPTLRSLHEEGHFALLGVVELPAKRTGKRALAVGVMVGVVAVAAGGLAPILVSALAGLVVMVLTGCVTAQEVYEGIDWSVVVLLGSLLALGGALENSGAAEYLAHHLVDATRALGPYGILAGLYLLTTTLTGLISNNAAGLILTPIAIAVAGSLGVAPMPLVIGVMFAASNSFVTPVGYQTNTFIFGPGGYRFADFLIVGGPLTLVMTAVAAWVIPLVFPF